MSDRLRLLQDVLMVVRCFFVGHDFVDRHTKRVVSRNTDGSTNYEIVKTVKVCKCCERVFLVYDKEGDTR